MERKKETSKMIYAAFVNIEKAFEFEEKQLKKMLWTETYTENWDKPSWLNTEGKKLRKNR